MNDPPGDKRKPLSRWRGERGWRCGVALYTKKSISRLRHNFKGKFNYIDPVRLRSRFGAPLRGVILKMEGKS